MGIFDEFERRYADREFSTGTMVEPSRATIDHGRLLTLRRRDLFSRLHAEITGSGSSVTWQVPNEALLSPRRIDRILEALNLAGSKKPRGEISACIADEIFRLLQAWRDGGLTVPIHEIGYPVVVGEAGRVGGWTIRLVLT